MLYLTHSITILNSCHSKCSSLVISAPHRGRSQKDNSGYRVRRRESRNECRPHLQAVREPQLLLVSYLIPVRVRAILGAELQEYGNH